MRTFKTIRFIVTFILVLIGFYSNAQLNGINYINPAATNYSGNPGGASGKSYTSFNNAISALVSYGVTSGGTGVRFVVSPGVYNEFVQVTAAITNASTTNRITFDGQQKSTVKLTTTSNNPTIRLYYASYFTFQNMVIENLSPTYAYAVNLQYYASYNQFNNCNIQVPIGSNSNYIPVVFSNSSTTYGSSDQGTDYNEFNNNIISGGYFGITLYSYTTSTAYNNYNKFIGNTITDVYYYGMYMYYAAAGMVIKNNTFKSFGTTSAYAIYTYYSTNLTIDGNTIYPGTYGIYLNYDNYYITSNSSYLMNNAISNFSYTSYNCGIYTNYCYNTYILHNSIRTAGSSNSSSYPALYSYYGYTQTIKNNIFYSSSVNYLFYFYSSGSYSVCDYNDWYYNGTSSYFYYQGNTYTTLATFVANNTSYLSTHDVNSINTDPGWVSATDLHRNATSSTLLQVPYISTCSTDFDGDSRSGSLANIGCDEIKANDADITVITPNNSFIIGNNTISATVINRGYNTLSGTITLQYQIDGGSWTSQTFTIATALTINQTATYTFSTPWNATVNGYHTLGVRIYPQITGDPDGSDLKTAVLRGGFMSGTFYIDGTGAGNYLTFSAAATDLNMLGAGGPCIFIVRPGIYTERLMLTSVAGTSPTNTITFDGQFKPNVYLNYTGSSTTLRATVLLNDTRYITFKNMTIQNLGTSYGVAVMLMNNSSYNTIDNCDINVDPGSTNSYVEAIVATSTEGTTPAAAGTNASYTTIKNSNITGGYYGLVFYGTNSTTFDQGNQILNCNISATYQYAVDYYYQRLFSIKNCNIDNAARYTSSYSIYGYYSNRSTLEANKIYTGRYGIYLQYENYLTPTDTSYLTNNMVSNFSNVNYNNGIYIYYSYYMNVLHNSVWVTGNQNGSGYAAFYSYYGDGCTIKNNIFTSNNSNLVFSSYLTTGVCDYNDFYYTVFHQYVLLCKYILYHTCYLPGKYFRGFWNS